jgi:lipopolysaccharide transport system ATP-binding protein
VFDFGEQMTIRVTYKAFQRIERPDFRVGLNRSDDIHCTTFSTIADDIDIPFVEGEGVIEVRTPPISLVSDLYSVNVVVRERGYGGILTAQVGGGFHVRHPVFQSNAFGIFHESGKWRFEPSRQATASPERKHELR